MNEEIKSSFLILKESLRLSLKNLHFVGILVVLGWIPVEKLATLHHSFNQVFLYLIIYFIIYLYITAGIYPCVWKNIINGTPNFKFFTSSAKRFFLYLLVVMIGIGVLGWLVSLPFFLFSLLYDWITEAAQDCYKLVVDPCRFLGLCLTIYVFPFLFTQNMLGMRAVSQGVKFVFKHFKRSLPLFAVVLIQVLVFSISQSTILINKNLSLYLLFGFLKQFILPYISVLIFIAASIILENAYRKGDV